MLKNTLESTIEKYYLNGLCEAVKIVIKNKEIVISFSPAEDKSLIGKVTCKNFDVADCTIGVYNTTQLLKLIKILDHNILVTINQERTIADKLLISDNKYDLEYYLAELNLIKPIPKVKEPGYNVEIDLTMDNFITKFINAKKALGDIKQFRFEANQLGHNQATFELGDGTSYSNKIRFNTPTQSTDNINPMPFSANLFHEILIANKECDKGKFQISKEGLIKMIFNEGDLESEYFLIRLEE